MFTSAFFIRIQNSNTNEPRVTYSCNNERSVSNKEKQTNKPNGTDEFQSPNAKRKPDPLL